MKRKELEEKLDNGENVFLLDTRNNYEINIGSFKNAKNLNQYLDQLILSLKGKNTF